MKMPISMPLPRKKMPSPMPSPMPMPMPTPTRKMPRFLILMPLVAFALGFSAQTFAAAKDERPKSAKGHLRSYPTEEARLTSCMEAWDARLKAVTPSEDLREVHTQVNKEMEEELASLHRVLTPSLPAPTEQGGSLDSEESEEEDASAHASRDASAQWAKSRMENWQIWIHTGVNPEAKKRTHQRGSSVSLASIASEEEEEAADAAFKRKHDTVKEAMIATFLDLARKVDAKKGTLV